MPGDEYRVAGPPGTGKTTWLAGQIANAAKARGSTSVVVASFTRAAAAELGTRGLPIPSTHLGTLHGLCYRALGKPEIAETRVADFNDQHRAFSLTGGLDVDEPEQVWETEGDRLMAAMQLLRSRQRDRDRWPQEVQRFAKAWDGFKADENLIDFTDMIELTIELFMPPPDGATIGFFDEVQDFTPLELGLVRFWGEHFLEQIVLAGDDDQCIYSFKGASPQAFLEPPVPDDQRRVLGQSYRMPKAVHEVSQDWISQLTGDRWVKQFAARDEEGAVERRVDLRYKSTSVLVDELVQASQSGTVMALAACGYQMAPIVAELRSRGELFHNPYRTKRGDWNPLAPGQGRSAAQRLSSLLAVDDRIAGEAFMGDHTWTFDQLRDWAPLVRKTGVFRRGRLSSIEDQPGDQPVTLATLLDIFEEGVVSAIRNDPLTWVRDHAASARAKGLEYPLKVMQLRGIDALVDADPKIIVGTIHSVKGGQADDVFLLPDVSVAGHRQWLDTRTRDHAIRQFYVGMSRASRRLVLCGQSTPTAIQWR